MPSKPLVFLGHTQPKKTSFQQSVLRDSLLTGFPVKLTHGNYVYLDIEIQSRFLREERKRDESDILEYQDKGTLLKDFLGEDILKNRQEELKQWDLQPLLEQGMAFLSTGERRKAFLLRLLKGKPDTIILENPLEGLDHKSCRRILRWLSQLDSQVLLFLNRLEDIPKDNENIYLFKEDHWLGPLKKHDVASEFVGNEDWERKLNIELPPPPQGRIPYQDGEELVHMDGVNLSYYGKVVLKDIHWTIRQGEFWQLIGPNGSGKSSLISMINGDNPRAFGQRIRLFGQWKGSGESLWDLREKMGYFHPLLEGHLPDRISLGDLILSGFYDSYGLYKTPKGYHVHLMKNWLKTIHWDYGADDLYHEVPTEVQRIVLLIRSMVKHPSLLLLDEPLSGLSQSACNGVARWVNEIAQMSHSAIVLVSHRDEPLLTPQFILRLQVEMEGSISFVEDLR